ncbi:hypothetical protein LTR85_002030 [Meristemomyces frigidus]|nr:hypothetical protein LTR85_002030 [Meristemomyces frigidus]
MGAGLSWYSQMKARADAGDAVAKAKLQRAKENGNKSARKRNAEKKAAAEKAEADKARNKQTYQRRKAREAGRGLVKLTIPQQQTTESRKRKATTSDQLDLCQVTLADDEDDEDDIPRARWLRLRQGVPLRPPGYYSDETPDSSPGARSPTLESRKPVVNPAYSSGDKPSQRKKAEAPTRGLVQQSIEEALKPTAATSRTTSKREHVRRSTPVHAKKGGRTHAKAAISKQGLPAVVKSMQVTSRTTASREPVRRRASVPANDGGQAESKAVVIKQEDIKHIDLTDDKPLADDGIVTASVSGEVAHQKHEDEMEVELQLKQAAAEERRIDLELKLYRMRMRKQQT